ncbi:hypothetical protein DDZ18_02270 [Marinicauda salina]|uniref:Uncharacterized protein n=1 Tax=Marinicauda salina TaxID=2135793 RepID=A0A2U2BWQ7_9PROT|nr:hypothetical protein [Marinicauda salina]PWE18453.1 hypothetical protein DDZ18_02270 [Marinicauda salina]
MLELIAALALQTESIRCEIEYEGSPPDPDSAALACPPDPDPAALDAAEAALESMDVRQPEAMADDLRRTMRLEREDGVWRVRRWPTNMEEPQIPLAVADNGFAAVCEVTGSAIPDGRMTEVEGSCASAHDDEPAGEYIRELYRLAVEVAFSRWRYSPAEHETREQACFRFQLGGGESLEEVQDPPC